MSLCNRCYYRWGHRGSEWLSNRLETMQLKEVIVTRFKPKPKWLHSSLPGPFAHFEEPPKINFPIISEIPSSTLKKKKGVLSSMCRYSTDHMNNLGSTKAEVTLWQSRSKLRMPNAPWTHSLPDIANKILTNAPENKKIMLLRWQMDGYVIILILSHGISIETHYAKIKIQIGPWRQSFPRKAWRIPGSGPSTVEQEKAMLL